MTGGRSSDSRHSAVSRQRSTKPVSRRAEAVETSGSIRPMRIAEVGGAAGEGVGAHGRPDGSGQVRGCINHDDPAVGPGDVESKLIQLHAEAGIAGLHLRPPQRGRTTGQRRPPAAGLWQVITIRSLLPQHQLVRRRYRNISGLNFRK